MGIVFCESFFFMLLKALLSIFIRALEIHAWEEGNGLFIYIEI